MDTQGILGILAGVFGVAATAYSIGQKQAIGSVDHKVRGIEQWRAGLPAHLDATYVRQKELALELKPLHETLVRIEADIKAMRGEHP